MPAAEGTSLWARAWDAAYWLILGLDIEAKRLCFASQASSPSSLLPPGSDLVSKKPPEVVNLYPFSPSCEMLAVMSKAFMSLSPAFSARPAPILAYS